MYFFTVSIINELGDKFISLELIKKEGENLFNNIGSTEIIIVAVVVLILFFPKKLPEFAKGLVQFFKEIGKSFKEGTSSK